jgi:hypothetical protein
MSVDSTGYPSRPKLSDSDMYEVLRRGAPLRWFEPFAVLGEVRTERPGAMPFGLAHVYYDAKGNRKTDVRTFHTEEDARWALEILYRRHRKSCRCLCIFYWTPAMVNYGIEHEEAVDS